MHNIEIDQMNEAIALFMGLKPRWVEYPDPALNRLEVWKTHSHSAPMEYHSLWGWLMPVVEKISKIRLLNADGTPCVNDCDVCYPITFNMPSPDGKVMFRFAGFSLHTEDKLIDAAHAACYEVAEIVNNKQKEVNNER